MVLLQLQDFQHMLRSESRHREHYLNVSYFAKCQSYSSSLINQ